MSELKRNKMLNLIKGFACIGVVLIHVRFPGIVGKIVSYISLYAVPVFYMIAGYYAFGKNSDTVKRRLIKIVKIFIFAYMIFFLFYTLIAIKNNQTMDWLANTFKISSIAEAVVFCFIDFAIPLWYLIAQIETYIFWYFTIKLKKEGFIIKLLPVLFVLHVSLLTFFETKDVDFWHCKYNFVIRSLPWFVLGYYLRMLPEEKINKISDRKIIAMCGLGGVAIALIPIVFNLQIQFSYAGYIPYAAALFIIGLKHSDVSICKPIEYLGDKLSLWVYIFHVPMGLVLKMIVVKVANIDTETGIYSWIHPILTVFAVIGISYIFDFFYRKFLKSNKKLIGELQ